MKTNKIINILIMVLGIVFLISSPSLANDSKELDEIKHAIKKHGAKWTAGETSVSKMDPEERNAMILTIDPEEFESIEFDSNGLDADEIELMEEEEEEPGGSMESISPFLIPITPTPVVDYGIDYRKDGWIPPVRFQGLHPTCWAFATTALLETYALQMMNRPFYDLDLSEQVLTSCSTCDLTCIGGTTSCASNFIRATGLPLESCSVYTGCPGVPGVCAQGCLGPSVTRYRMGGWQGLTKGYGTATVTFLKNALRKYGPLTCWMQVWTDFRYYKSGIYEHVKGTLIPGGHYVLIIGYDTAEQCFIVKNSWSTGWGESGFGRIAYSQVDDKDVQFGTWAMRYYSTP